MSERWAYLGPEGTFTEQAALDLAAGPAGNDPAGKSLVRHPVELQSQPNVGAAIAAVRDGSADAAVVPLENSVEGTVATTHDGLIHDAPLRIVAEAFVPVRFDLLVRPGTEPQDVHRIGSHPHGHAQVREFLAATFPKAEEVVTGSTAAAAQLVAAGEVDAAAAAQVAGQRYGLTALASNIGLNPDAVTRFVLLRGPAARTSPTGNDRTSFVLHVPNRPGTLLEVLGEIAHRGVNLTRLESRPTREVMGEYLFWVDADGHVAEPAMADTVAALHRRGALHRFLGSYPRGRGQVAERPSFAGPDAFAAAERFVAELTAEREPG